MEKSYPIVDGIIDFVVDSQPVSKAYDSLFSYYDAGLTSATFLTKTYNKLVWGLHDQDYVKKVLSLFPNAKNQVILDVPVGQGSLPLISIRI
jgi:hypothetical protein